MSAYLMLTVLKNLLKMKIFLFYASFFTFIRLPILVTIWINDNENIYAKIIEPQIF